MVPEATWQRLHDLQDRAPDVGEAHSVHTDKERTERTKQRSGPDVVPAPSVSARTVRKNDWITEAARQ
jgi:hypothetical protein